MFSDHLKKVDDISNHKLLLVAALLVIVCQLIAMAMVAGGQVKKAELRNTQLAVGRMALANCYENSVGNNTYGCMPQARAATAPYEPVNRVLTDVVADVVSVAAGEYGNAEGRMLSQMAAHQAALASGPAGMMAISFARP